MSDVKKVKKNISVIVKDVSVLVPGYIDLTKVEDIIENTGGKELWTTELASFYDGPDLEEADKKSLTFRLTFQSEKRGLKGETVEKIVSKIKKALVSKGWEVKK